MGFVARVCQPSTLRMLVWPEASSAQNNMAAVSADGSTVCVKRQFIKPTGRANRQVRLGLVQKCM